MVEITATTKKDFADVFKVARRDKMRVVWLREDRAYVARTARGHGDYIVRLYAMSESRVKLHCRSIEGQTCEGMRFNGICSHAAALILRSQRRFKRQDRRVA